MLTETRTGKRWGRRVQSRAMIESVDRSRYAPDDDARIKEEWPDAQTSRAGSLRRSQPAGDSRLQRIRSLTLSACAGNTTRNWVSISLVIASQRLQTEYSGASLFPEDHHVSRPSPVPLERRRIGSIGATGVP